MDAAGTINNEPQLPDEGNISDTDDVDTVKNLPTTASIKLAQNIRLAESAIDNLRIRRIIDSKRAKELKETLEKDGIDAVVKAISKLERTRVSDAIARTFTS